MNLSAKKALRTSFLLIAISLFSFTCSGCKPHAKQAWSLTDVQGYLPDLEFRLTTRPDSKPVTATGFRGKLVLLYFGYLHCPDVCPMTMSRLGGVLRQLGPTANDVRILFVSVDPSRDTTPMLQTYAQAFSPEAVGLTGTPRQIEAMAKRYRVAYQAEPADAGENYEVTHSKAVYVFDRDGHARLMIRESDQPDAIVHDLRQLAASAP